MFIRQNSKALRGRGRVASLNRNAKRVGESHGGGGYNPVTELSLYLGMKVPFGASHGYGYTKLTYISGNLCNDIIACDRRILNLETFLRLPATTARYSYGESRMASGTFPSIEQQQRYFLPP